MDDETERPSRPTAHPQTHRTVANGNPGDVRPVGNGVSELRLDVGPGCRVHCIQDGDVLILLLCGGDKSTQQKDIDKAHRLADEWRTDMKEAGDEQQE